MQDYKRPFFPKGLTLLVLEMVDRLAGDACGAAVYPRVVGVGGMYREKAQVYIALRRLEWHGLIRQSKVTKIGGAAARKFYTITDDGRAQLADARKMYARLRA